MAHVGTVTANSGARLRSSLLGRIRPAADDGFTIMEVLVAMMVIAVGLLGLMAVQFRSLSTVQLAKERQTATAYANRAMEQLRAIPYTALQGGLKCTELVGDPNVTVTNPTGSCSAIFSPLYDPAISGESVVTTTGTPVPPLSPHIPPAEAVSNGVTYVVRNYVTRVNPDPTVDAGYWLTVISSWSSNNTRGALKSMALRSEVYSPQGCLSPTTHPFSGPCQAFLYSEAGATAGSISVDATRPNSPIVDGLTSTSGSVSFSGLSARTQYEQTVSSQSSFVTAQAKLVAAATSSSGGISGSSTADTDPATGTTTSPAAPTTGTQSSSPLQDNGGGTHLDVTAAPNEAGSALSTTAAAASPVCADDNGAAISGGQTCATASLTPGGTSSVALTLSSLGTRVLTLADVEYSETPSQAFGARFPVGSASPAHCTATSGVGCVAAGTHRYLGTSHAGALPALTTGDKVYNTTGPTAVDVTAALGAGPLVTVSSYADRAYAESGIAPGASSAARSGTLSYWNGSQFTALNLATAAPGSYTIPQLTGVYGSTSIVAAGTVTITAPQAPSVGSADCIAVTCGVRATSGTVVARLTYSILSGGVQVGAFTVTLDLGSALAQTTYKGAPSA